MKYTGNRLGMILCGIIFCLSGAFADENNTAMGDVKIGHYYQLFTCASDEFPTRLQREMILHNEEIWQNTRGWMRPQKTDADRLIVSQATRAMYAKMCCLFTTIRVAVTDRGLEFITPPDTIELTRTISRPLIIEVQNNTSNALNIRPCITGSPQGTMPPGSIKAGQFLPFLIPCLADQINVKQVQLEIALPGDTGEVLTLPLSVNVSEPVKLKGTIREGKSKKLWPGKVRVECSDGVFRRGVAFADNDTLSRKPVVFRPAWWSLPFFYSDGKFEITVPAGTTVISLEQGFEHPVVAQTLVLKPGEKKAVTVNSSRFIDMKAQGWISGDTHVHWAKNPWDVNEDLNLLAMVQRAEDVRVVNNLTLYQWRSETDGGAFIKPDQFPPGPVPKLCDKDYHIQMAEEYRNDQFYGHINLLNIKEIIQPIATGKGSGGDDTALDWPLNRDAVVAAHAQGGISCEAHGFGSYTPAHVIHGLVDVMDQVDTKRYYQLLNCGFHLPLGDGSDHPARVVGCVRTYVKTSGDDIYRGWIDGLRNGRSFITSGPLLFLTVNGQEVGSVQDVATGEMLNVSVKAISRYPIGKLQIISNGNVMAEAETEECEAQLRLTMPVDKSQWIAARCSRTGEFMPIRTPEDDYTARPDMAHTSPCYIQVDGRKIFDLMSAQEMLAITRWHAEHVRQNAKFANDTQRDEAVGYFNDAAELYEALIAQEAK